MSASELDRRTFLAAGAATPFAARMTARPDAHDVRDWPLHGRGWTDTLGPFDRLPRRAQESVRDAVWRLQSNPAGVHADFETDSAVIEIEYELANAGLAMPHMPATGKSGVDVYARNAGEPWRWVACARPTSTSVELVLKSLAPGKREYRLYLPLYSDLSTLTVRAGKATTFRVSKPPAAKPLVMYGTSIMQGACASRPGMAFTSILGRRLDVPVINLGFSGNGRMEAALGELLVELDAAVYVVDCLPNMNAQQVSERTVPLVEQLRAAHPRTPIVLAEDRVFTNAGFFPGQARHHAANHAALRAAFEDLRQAGVEGLTYLADAPFLGADGEATMDGSHPSDLGMVRYADAYEPVLRELL